jgi:hypothetical protein
VLGGKNSQMQGKKCDLARLLTHLENAAVGYFYPNLLGCNSFLVNFVSFVVSICSGISYHKTVKISSKILAALSSY